MKKFYILGPSNNGEGAYYLLTEDGEHLASHFCSHAGFAKGDLESDRPERQKEWKEKYGEYEVLWIGDDELTKEELVSRNQEFYKEQIEAKKQQ